MPGGQARNAVSTYWLRTPQCGLASGLKWSLGRLQLTHNHTPCSTRCCWEACWVPWRDRRCTQRHSQVMIRHRSCFGKCPADPCRHRFRAASGSSSSRRTAPHASDKTERWNTRAQLCACGWLPDQQQVQLRRRDASIWEAWHASSCRRRNHLHHAQPHALHLPCLSHSATVHWLTHTHHAAVGIIPWFVVAEGGVVHPGGVDTGVGAVVAWP